MVSSTFSLSGARHRARTTSSLVAAASLIATARCYAQQPAARPLGIAQASDCACMRPRGSAHAPTSLPAIAHVDERLDVIIRDRTRLHATAREYSRPLAATRGARDRTCANIILNKNEKASVFSYQRDSSGLGAPPAAAPQEPLQSDRYVSFNSCNRHNRPTYLSIALEMKV